jgi:hypothetical protein
MLAFALVPVILNEAKPLARALGKGLRKLGDAVERIADNSQIDAEPSSDDTPTEKRPKKKKKKSD